MRTPTLRRNGDGRAFAVYPNSRGKRAYFGTFGTEDAGHRYALWLSEVMASVAVGEPACVVASLSIAELAVKYVEWSEQNHSPGEVRNTLDTLAGLLVPFCGDISGRRFGPATLRRFQSHLADSGRFARGTVNSHVKRARRFVRWCQSRELVPPGTVQELETVEPLRRGRTTARETEPIEPVVASVWRATLPFLRPQIRAMIQIQFWAGMRPGEVCSLRPSEVARSDAIWLYRPARHKTSHRGKTLIKAIPEPAQAILAPYLDGDPDGPVFQTQRGRDYTALTYGAAIRRAVRRARDGGLLIPPWHPNQLRHAILTEVRNLFDSERDGLEAARRWGGHSDSATTLIYTWTATSELRRIAAELGRRVG